MGCRIIKIGEIPNSAETVGWKEAVYEYSGDI